MEGNVLAHWLAYVYPLLYVREQFSVAFVLTDIPTAHVWSDRHLQLPCDECEVVSLVQVETMIGQKVHC